MASSPTVSALITQSLTSQPGNHHFEPASSACVALHVGRSAAGGGMLVPDFCAMQLQVCGDFFSSSHALCL
jgi:hypothetical protein